MKYERELHLALRLARMVGPIAMPYFRRKVRVIMKENDSPVTAADRRIELLLVEGILEHFPHDRVVGEEHGFRHGRRGRFWAIDPIDGTSSFSSQWPGFCTMIALIERGRPVLGVVAAPAQRRVYYAVRGHGAYMVAGNRRRRLHVAKRATSLREAVLGGPVNPQKSSEHSRRIRAMLAVRKRIPIGSAGLELGGVAAGTIDASVLTAVHLGIWDVAAGQVIVEEAGGRITDLAGRPFRYRWGRDVVKRGILAANPVLHANALRAVQQARVTDVLDRSYREFRRRLAKRR